jgi:hypothetical protein
LVRKHSIVTMVSFIKIWHINHFIALTRDALKGMLDNLHFRAVFCFWGGRVGKV